MIRRLLLLLALLPLPAAADDAPDAGRIVEALKPSQAGQRTRNIGVMRSEPPPPAQAIPVAPAAPALPPVVEAPALPVAEEAAQISLSVAFAFNSARLTSEGAKALDPLGLALGSEQLAGLRFRVEGHTDGKGGAAYNRKLSQARAEEVRRYLMFAHGIEGQRLLAVGKGASEPANPDDPLAAENRRVRIVTLGD